MDCSPQGSSVHGILQARTLEWVAISFSTGSSGPRDRTQFSHIAGRLFTNWATREATTDGEKFLLNSTSIVLGILLEALVWNLNVKWLMNITKVSYSLFAVVRSRSLVWLCNPMDCSSPGFPVLHCLPNKLHCLPNQTHVHWVNDVHSAPFLPPMEKETVPSAPLLAMLWAASPAPGGLCPRRFWSSIWVEALSFMRWLPAFTRVPNSNTSFFYLPHS